MTDSVAPVAPTAKKTRRSDEDLKASFQAQIALIEERQKVKAKGWLSEAKAAAELYVSKYPTTKAATFANQAIALLNQAIGVV
jgi:hypothetical protein